MVKESYHKADISLLSVPPHLRGVALTLQPQMPAPGLVAYIQHAVGEVKTILTQLTGRN